LFRRKREPVARSIKRLDAAEHGRVHENAVPSAWLCAAPPRFDREQVIVAVGAGQQNENVERARERLSARFERGRWCSRTSAPPHCRKCPQPRRVRCKCVGKGRAEMVRLDPVERGHPERIAPFLEQRIVVGARGYDLGLLVHTAHMGGERLHCTFKKRAGPKHVSMAAFFEFFPCERRATLLD